IYAGYLALRAFTEDPERRARWSAAVGILAFLDVPIVYMSVRWRSIHQVQSSPATVDSAYALGLEVNALAFVLLLIYLTAQRYHAARLERAAEALREEAALAPGGVHVCVEVRDRRVHGHVGGHRRLRAVPARPHGARAQGARGRRAGDGIMSGARRGKRLFVL